MPHQQAGEQARAVGADVEVRVVLEHLEPAERQGASVAIAQQQPVQHPLVPLVLLVDEQVHRPVLDLEVAAELVAGDRSDHPRGVLRVGDVAVHVGDVHRQPELAAPARAAAVQQGLVVVLPVEVDPARHALAERQAGHVEPAGRPSSIPSATRSAKAAIVKLGFGPTGPGSADPSAT